MARLKDLLMPWLSVSVLAKSGWVTRGSHPSAAVRAKMQAAACDLGVVVLRVLKPDR